MLILVVKCLIFHHNNVISADSIAISVQLHIAIQTSALVKAIASFIPSQTIATINPFSCSFFISSPLLIGRTSAITSSIQTSFAIDKALFFLSPVKIAVLIQSLCRFFTKSSASFLIVSAIQRVQSNSFSFQKNTGVCPKYSQSFKISHFLSSDNLLLLSSNILSIPQSSEIF
jgi:hypothetical protein